MRGRPIPSWLPRALGSVPPLVAVAAILFTSGTLRVVLLLFAMVGIAASIVVTLFNPISVGDPTPSPDLESREPQAFLDAFDAVMSSARPARPARFSKGVVLDGQRMSALLDEMRLFLVQALGDLKWYQWHREDEGKELLGDSLEGILDDFGASIDRLDDLVGNGVPVPFSSGKVRVDAQRLSDAAEPLRRWLASYAKELAGYRSLYPGQRERAAQIQAERETDLEKSIDAVDDLLNEAKVILLRDQVSIAPAAVGAITHRMRLALARERNISHPAEFEREIDRLDALVRDAKATPFSDEVRVGREEMYEVIEGMRDKLYELMPDD